MNLNKSKPETSLMKMALLFDSLGFFCQPEREFLHALQLQCSASESDWDRLNVILTQVCVRLNDACGSFVLQNDAGLFAA